ncbi:MAG: NADH-quinone oxidoreductase subunit L [Planctomycetota bacterium]|nr:MAG: NADH-quinone oxidoreductase subunit L [Planctomycetota bacterium]
MELVGDAAAVVAEGAGDWPAYLWLGILFFGIPLLSAITLIFWGKRIPKGGDWIAQTAIVSCAGMAIWMFFDVIVGQHDPGFVWSSAAQGLEWAWVKIGNVDLSVGIFYDNLTVIMLTMVTIVASCIFFFSAGYMHGDRDYSRFFAYLSYFCFAMLGLVVVDSLFFLFIFWELVGVGSYLLIGFFYDQEEPPKASMKAFMVNRVGDVLFLLGMILCWNLVGSLQYSDIFAAVSAGEFAALSPDHVLAGWDNHALLTLSGILIFCGAISKSAQIPLHTWLPDAMAGPTPVSALIHAATMVAAGVFMVGRMYPYFTPEALGFIAGIGAITALIGATIGLVMWDIKKVLAYSTMSQLGYMMLGLGVGGYVAGLFHLITHACFKACLFLGSGSVIHAVHSQDMRDMGGLRKKMPVTYWTFLISTLALAGVPMFAGYYSKDQIIATAMAWGLTGGAANWIPLLFGVVGAFMTTFYMFRLVFLTFHGKPADQHRYDHAHESPPIMAIPLIVLAGLAIFAGGTINPLPNVETLWFNELVPQPASAAAAGLELDLEIHRPILHDDLAGDEVADAHGAADPHAGDDGHGTEVAGGDEHAAETGELAAAAGAESHGTEHAEVHTKWTNALHASHYPALGLSLLAIGLGFYLARRMYLVKLTDPAVMAARFGPMHSIVSNKYYFDEIYATGVVGSLHKLNHGLARFDKSVIDGAVNSVGLLTRFLAFLSGLFDKYVVDGLVNFWRWFVRTLSGVLRLVQTGNVRDYLMWTVVGAIILAFIMSAD